ncbi:uncharacterized protein LOC130277528 [Hyla sarda]|uniref:uncharacterized protein LOC130277528 n=1 Tax=Hyla sarda TaxID=327740 RepID=UPI0024C388B3|nr:uncharacterized protein LOC130277528 [Hyla sarda]
MSGASPGRGHPGRGSSPSKAQASRPTLEENSQTLFDGDENPEVDVVHQSPQHGSTTSARMEDKEMDVCKAKKEAAESVCETRVMIQSAGQGSQCGEQPKGSQKVSPVRDNKSAIQGHDGAQEVRGSQAAGVQLHSPAQRQRRTSLERQTLQENLQQQEVVSSMTRSGRTRSQAGGKSQNTAEGSMGVTPGKFVEKSLSVCKTVPAPDSDLASADTSSHGSVFIQPESLSRPHQQGKETTRAPELQLAEEIPALVRRMEELKHQKQMLQMQIDCVYKLKTANPQYKSMHDNKLYTLSTELATIVSEMDCLLERMGPLAESYRNQERFSQYQLNFDSEPRSDVIPDITAEEPQEVKRPLIKPPNFTFKDQHKYGEQQHQRPAAVPKQEPAIPVPAEAPQVPEDPVHEEDSGHLPVYEAELTVAEVKEAIDKLHLKKAPGPDGITAEFYKTFRDLLAPILVDVYTNCLESHLMPPSMRVSSLILLSKGKEPSDIKNWRPIALLNVDRKILAKILFSRLVCLSPALLAGCQYGTVKGRNISGAVISIREMFERCKALRCGRYVVSLDQAKQWAFF